MGIQPRPCKFARDLHIKLWQKHLGMAVDTPTTGVQKEGAAPLGIKLEQPLAKESIGGIQRQASVNREAYNRVFTHTPRNTFGTLLEGRKHYPPQTKQVKKYSVNGVQIGGVSPDGKLRDPYILVDEPTGKLDFCKLPPLQSAYMTYGQHNIGAAIKELRGTVKGFFVEMPLEWGAKERVTPKPPLEDPAMIAEVDMSHRNKGQG